MNKRATKERLFEVTGKLDKTFKPRLNEVSYANNIDEFKNFVNLIDNRQYDAAKKILESFIYQDKMEALKIYLSEMGEYDAQRWVTNNASMEEEVAPENIAVSPVGGVVEEPNMGEQSESSTLLNFAKQHGLKIMKVNFKHGASGVAIKRKGFDLVDEKGQIQITLEPTSYNKDSMYAKDKWLVKDNAKNKTFYIGSLRELPKAFPDFAPAEHTGYSRGMEEEVNLNEASSISPIHNYVYFAYNFPSDFIEKAWANNPNIMEHLKSKFSSFYSKYGAQGVMNKFYTELDGENQKILEDWIMANYHG